MWTPVLFWNVASISSTGGLIAPAQTKCRDFLDLLAVAEDKPDNKMHTKIVKRVTVSKRFIKDTSPYRSIQWTFMTMSIWQLGEPYIIGQYESFAGKVPVGNLHYWCSDEMQYSLYFTGIDS